MSESIVRRFNGIRWHDSELLGLSVDRAGSEDQVKLSLQLLEGDALTPATVTFRECVYVEAQVYLQAKQMCADAISDAECYSSSDWKNAVSEPSPYDPIRGDRQFEHYLHFQIGLCAPGGTINILAKDFVLASAAPA
ncbi:MAG TPA: hypothetical protein VJP02_05040 [Candidatus Sulfotelmatobacter sp.]|nr:hypothetical protein [Candidatus Sulfotelmatobacter sp.]